MIELKKIFGIRGEIERKRRIKLFLKTLLILSKHFLEGIFI